MGSSSAPVDASLDVTESLSHKTLFHSFMPRYLSVPQVQQWLMNRDPVPPRFLSNFSSSLSYACMYFPPNSSNRGAVPYPVTPPFLDIGDIMLCENVYDGIAVGTLYNQREEHALGVIRDVMLKAPKLSAKPRARKFAVDLTVSNLEIIEFAWMEDHSLIISCRRLDEPIAPGIECDQLVLSGDLLFYDVIPPDTFMLGAPLLRMTLCEKPAICQFCGTRGIKTCNCPTSFKTRAPSTYSVPVPLSHSRFRDKHIRIAPQGPLAGMLATWKSYTTRLFNVNISGAFFIHWYKRAPDSENMVLFMSPKHPVPYEISCGSREQTLCLASAYVKRMKLCERAYAADARLYSYLSRGSDLNMLLDKDASNTPQFDDFLDVEQFDTNSFFLAEDPLIAPLDQDLQTNTLLFSNGSNTVDSASTNPSIASKTLEESSQLPSSSQEDLIVSDKALSTSTVLSGDTSSHRSHGELSNSVSPDLTPPRKPPMRSRHVLDNGFDTWDKEPTNTAPAPIVSRPPRLTLSTTSRELQQYMTVDASNTPTCKECGASFPKRGNLARHIQTVHLKLKPFQCEHCHASFGYKNHLKRHQIIHQRGTEFKCRVCNRECKSQAQLTRHIQQAHPKDAMENGSENSSEQGDRSRVSCDICGVSFSQKSNLSRHRLIHEGLRFVCPICPNKTSFGQRYDLQRHLLRKHPGVSESYASIPPERVGTV